MKEPSSATVTDPLTGWLVRVAVSASPSASVSLPRTPGAPSDSGSPATVLKASSTATGAVFGGATSSSTVRVTVVAADGVVPSSAR